MRLGGEGLGDVIGERPAAVLGSGGSGNGEEECAVQPDPFGVPCLQGHAQGPADAVEEPDDHALGDRVVLLAAAASGRGEGPLSVLGPVPLIGDEVDHVTAFEDPGIVAAAWCLDFQKRAEFRAAASRQVEGLGAAGWVDQQAVRHLIPEQISQPALRDAGQVDLPAVVADPDAEMLGLEVAGVLGVLAGEVDHPQQAEHRFADQPWRLPHAVEVQVRE